MSELLIVDGVSKCFSRGGEYVAAIDHASLRVNRGEIVMVVGSSLSGKTTLLQIAAATKRPDRGTVTLDGRELTDLCDRDRARLLGRDIAWLDRNGPSHDVEVARFVGWPLSLHGHKRRRAEHIATQTLARVGMRGHSTHKWRDLSHRQRVLANLARAFAGDPRLVVADDLLNGLGGRATEETIDLLKSLVAESRHHPGVLLSVCEMDATAHANRVLSIHGGVLKPMTGLLDNDAEVIPFPDARLAEG